MRNFLTIVALATCLLGGYGNASAANPTTAMTDSIGDQSKNTRGIGSLLGSFLGGAPSKKAEVKQDTVSTPQKSDAKDAVGNLIGSFLGDTKGETGGKDGKIGDVIGSIFNGIAGNKLSAEMLVGTWSYTSSKCVLKSDDIVKKLGSEAMVAPIEKKLNNYLAMAGFKPGSFSYTFKEDGTFTANLSGRPIKGKYTLDLENKTITLNFFSLVKTTQTLTVVNNKLGMVHDADKLLALVRAIASKSKTTTIKSLNSILSAYDGLQIGMEFDKDMK